MFTSLVPLFDIGVAYLLGSICSAIIVCRLFDLPDPCAEGSKNPGATNVLRIAGKHYAAMVLIGDMLKGLIPVLLAKLLGAGPALLGFTCLAAVFGHIYPVFFGFKGGKGVATAIGGLLGLHLMLGVFAIGFWLIIANFTRYASLASVLTVLFAPIISLPMIGNSRAFLPLMFIAILVIYKHLDNITRLMDGKEGKINFRFKTHTEAPKKTSAAPKESPKAKADIKPQKAPEASAKKTQAPKPAKAKETRAKTTK